MYLLKIYFLYFILMNNNIFIIGCGHSGTTILNKILSNHKNIYDDFGAESPRSLVVGWMRQIIFKNIRQLPEK